MSELITSIAENFIKQFAHKPTVIVMDSAKEFDPTIFASGMVRDGSIYLFRDGLKDIKDVEKTLWHELLHHGLSDNNALTELVSQREAKQTFVRKKCRRS